MYEQFRANNKVNTQVYAENIYFIMADAITNVLILQIFIINTLLFVKFEVDKTGILIII
jgi:hypothetical protein